MAEPRLVWRQQITNDRTNTMPLVIEPWGDVIPLLPGQSVEVEFRGEVPGQMGVELGADFYLVCGWPTSRAQLWHGAHVLREYPIPVPDVPAGMTVRQFLNLVLGDAKTAR